MQSGQVFTGSLTSSDGAGALMILTSLSPVSGASLICASGKSLLILRPKPLIVYVIQPSFILLR